jgi:hypothetical protein
VLLIDRARKIYNMIGSIRDIRLPDFEYDLWLRYRETYSPLLFLDMKKFLRNSNNKYYNGYGLKFNEYTQFIVRRRMRFRCTALALVWIHSHQSMWDGSLGFGLDGMLPIRIYIFLFFMIMNTIHISLLCYLSFDCFQFISPFKSSIICIICDVLILISCI